MLGEVQALVTGEVEELHINHDPAPSKLWGISSHLSL